MVKTTVDIPEQENRILNIVKGKHGFKNKEQALIFILKNHMENLEPEIRPEYVEKLRRIEKEGNYKSFNSVAELRKSIENA